MKRKVKIEYGDFQTPIDLTRQIISLLKSIGIQPSVVIEPTCGTGNFLLTSIDTLHETKEFYGFDINENYIENLKTVLLHKNGKKCFLKQNNFFQFDWKKFFKSLSDNVLIIGNPPWVTNAALGMLNSNNLPEKNNFQNHAGFAAKTGKANFDIAEWILIKLLENLKGKKACIAMLCKTATARKVLKHAWINKFGIEKSSLHLIDAAKYFNVAVDACLFITNTTIYTKSRTAKVFSGLNFRDKVCTLGIIEKDLIADAEEYKRFKDLDGIEYYKWRSGVKHDAAKVMEFTKKGAFYVNGLGENCDLEDEYLYPLLKSSDLGNKRLKPEKYVLLTQHDIREDTASIQSKAPKTWQYLLKHAKNFDKRKSIIYQKRPRFSIFGVGKYTFSQWKVAVSGFYKNIHFSVIGKYNKKPILVDDTCYFVPCQSKIEADFVANLLNSDVASRFIHSLVFFDAKRPVNIDILKRIDLKKLAERLEKANEATRYLADAEIIENQQQMMVFEKGTSYNRKNSRRKSKLVHAQSQ